MIEANKKNSEQNNFEISQVKNTRTNVKNSVFALIFYSIELTSNFCVPIAWFSSFTSDNSNFIWKIEDGINFPKHFLEFSARQIENKLMIEEMIQLTEKYKPNYEELVNIIKSEQNFTKYPYIFKWFENLSKIPWLEQDLDITKKDTLIILKNELNQLNLLNQAKINYNNEKFETISASIASILLFFIIKFLAKTWRLKDNDWLSDKIRKIIYRKLTNKKS